MAELSPVSHFTILCLVPRPRAEDTYVTGDSVDMPVMPCNWLCHGFDRYGGAGPDVKVGI